MCLTGGLCGHHSCNRSQMLHIYLARTEQNALTHSLQHIQAHRRWVQVPYMYSPTISEGVSFWLCIVSEDLLIPVWVSLLLIEIKRIKKHLSFLVINAVTFLETLFGEGNKTDRASTNTCIFKMLPVTGLNEIINRSFSDINAPIKAGTTRMVLLKEKVDLFSNAWIPESQYWWQYSHELQNAESFFQ